MPMRSQAQRRWMWATHPAMARRWEAHTPRGKELPEHVGDAKKRERAPRDKAGAQVGPLRALGERFGIAVRAEGPYEAARKAACEAIPSLRAYLDARTPGAPAKRADEWVERPYEGGLSPELEAVRIQPDPAVVDQVVDNAAARVPGIVDRASLSGGLMGGALGSVLAPPGHRGEGALRGAGAGVGTRLGMSAGIPLGVLAGAMVGSGSEANLGAGGLVGGVGGHLLANRLMGASSWEREEVKEALDAAAPAGAAAAAPSPARPIRIQRPMPGSAAASRRGAAPGRRPRARRPPCRPRPRGSPTPARRPRCRRPGRPARASPSLRAWRRSRPAPCRRRLS
jgi:hypothetical protein